MKSISKLFFLNIAILFSCSNRLIGQTKATLSSIDSSYQACLNKGSNMYGCAETHYKQMDSMLNVVYKELINKDPDSYESIKNDERTWIKTRNRKFTAIDELQPEKELNTHVL